MLELREAPTPEPGPGQVRIAVEAAGVNFADILARQGLYPDAPSLPTVVGRRGAVRTLEVPLSDDERAGLTDSARAIRAVIDQIG